MNIEDVKLGMTVRVGPYPSTDDEPYYDRDDDDSRRYVNPIVGDATGTVTQIGDGTYGPDVVKVSFALSDDEHPGHQFIHVAHLAPYTAEPSSATVDAFNQIVGGAELDDLRSLGDKLDTDAHTASSDTVPVEGNVPGWVSMDDVPVTDTPVPGQFSLYPMQEGDHSTYVDPDDDTLDMLFRESNCANHGYEAAFYLAINGAAVVINPATALQIAQYIAERAQRIRDRGEDIV